MSDLKTIAIEEPAFVMLDADSEQTGMKKRYMVGAWGRGWRMLTPEQQAQALRIVPADAAPTTLGGDDCDPCDAGLRAARTLATLNEAIHSLARDGVLDANDRKRIAPIQKRLERDVVSINTGIDKGGKRPTRRKGRAA